MELKSIKDAQQTTDTTFSEKSSFYVLTFLLLFFFFFVHIDHRNNLWKNTIGFENYMMLLFIRYVMIRMGSYDTRLRSLGTPPPPPPPKSTPKRLKKKKKPERKKEEKGQ